jgi:hypothetical protein
MVCFQMVSFMAIKWSKQDWKSNDHLMGYNKMAAKNCLVLGWLFPAEIDH